MAEINIDLDPLKKVPGELERLLDSAKEHLEAIKQKVPFEANQLRNIIERIPFVKK